MADKDAKTTDTATTDDKPQYNSESPAVNKLNEMRDNEPVQPTPTTEGRKADEDNELSDNQRKAENELAELERTNDLHITDDYHKPQALEETIEYEKGQKEQRAIAETDPTHPEVAHGQQVTDKENHKREEWQQPKTKT